MTSFSRAQHPFSAISSRKTSLWPSEASPKNRNMNAKLHRISLMQRAG